MLKLPDLAKYMDNKQIMLPSHPLFNVILTTPPPDYKGRTQKEGVQINFIKKENGIFKSANPSEVEEYLYGGEYNEVLENNGMG